jgi:hydrogenase maturation protein HypF
MQYWQFQIQGIVQGVGFRPYIYRQAKKAGIWGYVKNTGQGVEIVSNRKGKMLKILTSKNLPPLAEISDLKIKKINRKAFKTFKILKSQKGQGDSLVPADIFLCQDCLKELRNKTNPRYNYFFITCTNCGPRYSIIQKTPYDRPNTSMKKFKICSFCQEEYQNPSNRRYHAQTVACSKCGPRLELYYQGKPITTKNPIKKAAQLLKKGEILAIKGIGGFHWACLCRDKIVKELRKITGRPFKPFAIMAKDFNMLKKIVKINKTAEKLLTNPARPIVVLNKKQKKSFKEISSLDTLGVMLPYTGLHYLLFDFLNEPLVMTSGNFPDEPITYQLNQQPFKYCLNHNRPIINPIDDSVIKVIKNQPLFLRRSRGYVPLPITFNQSNYHSPNQTILALGAELANTICLYKNNQAILSEYLGNTANFLSFERFKKTVNKFLKFYQAKPDLIAVDLHPQYNTAKYGQELAERLKVPLVKIQHHLAHIFSVAGECNLKDFVGISCDGLGYGLDEKIWGGEIFKVKDGDIKRIGSLEEQIMIGGDLAVKEPARMLLSILTKFLDKKDVWRIMKKFYSQKEFELLYNQLQENFNCFATTSTGRVLDAASVFLGFCLKRTYEGEPAMKLEANSSIPYSDLKSMIIKQKDRWILKATPIFEYLIKNNQRDKKRLAATVQLYLAQGLLKIAQKYKKPIVFSGGVAYNRIITSYFLKHGVLVNQQVPAGDGGISFGQINYVLNKLFR